MSRTPASSCTRSSKSGPRRPDEDQLTTIESAAFQNWYGEKKDAVTITRELLVDLALS